MTELPSYARPIAGGLELRLKVVAGASRSEIAGALGDRLKIRVSAPAKGGQANRAVVELISEWLSSSDVRIVAGHGRAEKTVAVGRVSALPRDAFERRGESR